MKLLAKLEKNRNTWILIGVSVLFFFLRFPSIIEPYWYGDEGIYEVVGQAMDHGELLYRNIWDNKPPLLYIVYALAHGNQPTVKAISLAIGIVSLIAFFLLAKKLLKKSSHSMLITILFVILFGTPLLEANIANAEDFILLPVLLAGLLIYSLVQQSKIKQHTTHNTQRTTFISGLLLGIAFLFKIVAIFDFAAFTLFLIMYDLPETLSWQAVKKLITKKIRPISYLLLGFLLPLLITIVYFATNNALTFFFQSVFFGNISYVGWENSLLGIPQGLLIGKTILLFLSLLFIIRQRKRFTRPALFVILWIVFSLYNIYFSGRPYTHYAIVLIPSFCLLVGLLFTTKKILTQAGITIGILLIIVMIWFQFSPNITWSFLYYQNAIQFITGQKSVNAYQTFFNPHVPRDYAIASFITTHTQPSQTVFIWGNDPQIYALSHKIPPIKYTVAYHVTENNALNQTQQIINKVYPKYIIVLKESQPLPFAIPLYIMRYSTSGATIYERSL